MSFFADRPRASQLRQWHLEMRAAIDDRELKILDLIAQLRRLAREESMMIARIGPHHVARMRVVLTSGQPRFARQPGSQHSRTRWAHIHALNKQQGAHVMTGSRDKDRRKARTQSSPKHTSGPADPVTKPDPIDQSQLSSMILSRLALLPESDERLHHWCDFLIAYRGVFLDQSDLGAIVKEVPEDIREPLETRIKALRQLTSKRDTAIPPTKFRRFLRRVAEPQIS